MKKKISKSKKEVKQIDLKLKRISEESEVVRKLLKKKDTTIKKRRSKRNISYINWLDNERRARNLISP